MASFVYAVLMCLGVLYFNNNLVACDEVPTILWNVKGNPLQLKVSSALDNDDAVFKSSLKDVIDSNANILVFAVNQFSMEDFSASEKALESNSTLQNLQTFLDTQRFMMLSSVRDPLSRIHDVAHCGVQEIALDHSIDDNVLKSISQAFSRSCVVIVHLMDSGIIDSKATNADTLKKVFLPTLPENSKNVAAIFTGLKSSWGNDVEVHRFRNLLATAENVPNLVNVSGCLLMYGANATVWFKANNKTVDLPFPVDTKGSECGNGTALLMLNFKPSGEEAVVIRFNFTRILNSWVTAVDMPEMNQNLKSVDIEAPIGFSFSCGDFSARDRNRTVRIKMEKFQVQPFVVSSSQFSDSFDCVTWFTIPIWMGIMVAILFIIIVNVGVYALFAVHTMDRFDDPKGKTISVATGVE